VYKRKEREFVRQETGREGTTKESGAIRSRGNGSKGLKKGKREREEKY